MAVTNLKEASGTNGSHFGGVVEINVACLALSVDTSGVSCSASVCAKVGSIARQCSTSDSDLW